MLYLIATFLLKYWKIEIKSTVHESASKLQYRYYFCTFLKLVISAAFVELKTTVPVKKLHQSTYSHIGTYFIGLTSF